MTREEAIINLQVLLIMADNGRWDTTDATEAVKVAISALRPVSREQVERMWPGCEACKDAGLAIGEVQFYGTFEGHIDVTGNIHYCPNCGRPITPIAKKKQEERLEVLHDD